jgi:hypothetical protein
MKTYGRSYLKTGSKLVLICVIMLIRTAGTLALTDKKAGWSSKNKAPRYERAILPQKDSDRNLAKHNTAQDDDGAVTPSSKPQYYSSCIFNGNDNSEKYLSYRDNSSPRGPPISG